jgi:arsenate reductase (glutaredoxin)
LTGTALVKTEVSFLRRTNESTGMKDVIIYHNPECGTSRNTLALIRNTGIEPHLVEYLKCPPSRVMLKSLIARMGVSVRELVRVKGTPYHDLGLDDPAVTDDQLLDAMLAHPILINRPIVVTPLGVKLCRPSEDVLDLLPYPQLGEFRKEDGELVVDSAGHRVS